MPVEVETVIVRQAANGRRNGKSRAAVVLRRLHFWTGAILTLNFLLLAATGTLIQHREFFGLEERTVSRKWLPAGYRTQDPDTEIRADIVVTDLHSGRMFGAAGRLAVDLAAAGFVLMIATGFGVQIVCGIRNGHKPDS